MNNLLTPTTSVIMFYVEENSNFKRRKKPYIKFVNILSRDNLVELLRKAISFNYWVFYRPLFIFFANLLVLKVPPNSCPAQAGQEQFKWYRVQLLASLFNKGNSTQTDAIMMAGETLNSFLLAGFF